MTNTATDRDSQRTMANSWTGGQYSVFRVLLGIHLLVQLLTLTPWDAAVSALDAALLSTAAMACVLLALGRFDRTAALFILAVLGWLQLGGVLTSRPALLLAVALLIAHALLPPAPFASLAAIGRTDPRGGWRLPRRVFVVAWTSMALGYSAIGFTRLSDPALLGDGALVNGAIAGWTLLVTEIPFVPLALLRVARPWIWLIALLVHGGILTAIGALDLALGVALVHFFTFDPGWIRPARPGAIETLFYDGQCGLCHHSVRFLLAEDTAGAFRFSPLEGVTFQSVTTSEERQRLPDSVVLITEGGGRLVRSRAILHLMNRLGGFWRILGTVLSIVPDRAADLVYDLVARIRRRCFRRPNKVCPLMPEDLRDRFLQ